MRKRQELGTDFPIVDAMTMRESLLLCGLLLWKEARAKAGVHLLQLFQFVPFASCPDSGHH